MGSKATSSLTYLWPTTLYSCALLTFVCLTSFQYFSAQLVSYVMEH